MPAPGFFEIYPAARPPLPAGTYTATTTSQLQSAPPHGDGAIPVDDSTFRIHIDSPRYVLPPSQVLSTFPPAGAHGDWRERLPQIVLKQRTLPWERNPDPAQPFETSPPWLALVVLADGEGTLSPDVDVAQCVTPGVDLGTDADAPKGKYLEVNENIVHKVFPCRDELHLLAHVRKVDLSDTELALGDDDGYLAVVLANRLPQPGPAGADGDATPLKYTAYLVNLEHQLDELLETEPDPSPFFDALDVEVLVDSRYLAAAPSLPLDAVAMNLSGAMSFERGIGDDVAARGLVPFSAASGTEVAAASWAIGPVAASATRNDDLAPARVEAGHRRRDHPAVGANATVPRAPLVGIRVHRRRRVRAADERARGRSARHRPRRRARAGARRRGDRSRRARAIVHDAARRRPRGTAGRSVRNRRSAPARARQDSCRSRTPPTNCARSCPTDAKTSRSRPGSRSAGCSRCRSPASSPRSWRGARSCSAPRVPASSVISSPGRCSPTWDSRPRAAATRSRTWCALTWCTRWPTHLLISSGHAPRSPRHACRVSSPTSDPTRCSRDWAPTPRGPRGREGRWRGRPRRRHDSRAGDVRHAGLPGPEALAGLRAHLGERVEQLTVDALNMRDAPPGRGRARGARDRGDGLDALIAEAEVREPGGPA